MSNPPIERATAEDMVSVATEVATAPMQIGAVLRLDTDAAFDPLEAIAAVAERVRAVPRLRQRLVATPAGCGRPVWVDDARFAIADHARVIECPSPGDEAALLAVAADVISTPLPRNRPLWRLAVVTGLDGGRTALVIAFHHVLADGIGGLAVLAHLVDGAAEAMTGDADFPRPAPPVRALAFEALRVRLTAFARLPGWLRRAARALVELRPTTRIRASVCSLNRPTGARRRYLVARTELEGVRRVAHAHGATVNDVVLTAVAGALHAVLRSRGESVDRFVVSVPVSARREASEAQLGNHVGVRPVELPGAGERPARLVAVAAITHATKETDSAVTALIGPAFRLLARLGIFAWFIDHQRVVHTFVTNLHGPDAALQFLGAPITDVIAVPVITGNVTVAFAVLSYAGTLAVTVIADPDAWADPDDLDDPSGLDDLAALRDALQHELDALVRSP